MSRIVDLRSDTVTRPVPGMREAIASAEVGDDVFGDDPTVKRLEEEVASLFRTEAALFVPSGTMGNTVALASITKPGDEVIVERLAHVFNNEVAAIPALAGVQFNPLDGEAGVITAEQIAAFIRPKPSLHQPETTVIALENTHNRAGGRVYPIEEMRRIRAMADEQGVKVHLDGARLANAVVASGIPFHEHVACADTVSMCFSKSLGAPVGSIVSGTAAMIDRARKKRKQLGGGMRQVGILAAAALYALEHHVERLRIDHDNARRLSEIIESTDGLEIVRPPETNIVLFRVDPEFMSVASFVERLRKRGVLANPGTASLVRMVTHLDVDASDIDVVAEVLGELAAR